MESVVVNIIVKGYTSMLFLLSSDDRPEVLLDTRALTGSVNHEETSVKPSMPGGLCVTETGII